MLSSCSPCQAYPAKKVTQMKNSASLPPSNQRSGWLPNIILIGLHQFPFFTAGVRSFSSRLICPVQYFLFSLCGGVSAFPDTVVDSAVLERSSHEECTCIASKRRCPIAAPRPACYWNGAWQGISRRMLKSALWISTISSKKLCCGEVVTSPNCYLWHFQRLSTPSENALSCPRASRDYFVFACFLSACSALHLSSGIVRH